MDAFNAMLAVPVGESDHVLGHDKAPVTLVEYGDFQCPTCKQAAPLVKLLLARYPRELRFVFRHFPLEEVHPQALSAALAAEAAGVQRMFWPMHDALFENQANLQARQLRQCAARLELDIDRYDAELDGAIHLQRVRDDIAGGNRIGIRATPTFFVNGVLHDVSFGMDALRKRIEAEALASPA